MAVGVRGGFGGCAGGVVVVRGAMVVRGRKKGGEREERGETNKDEREERERARCGSRRQLRKKATWVLMGVAVEEEGHAWVLMGVVEEEGHVGVVVEEEGHVSVVDEEGDHPTWS